MTDANDFVGVMWDAVQAGHSPGVYHRGNAWRVNLDAATGAWEDVESLAQAADWLRTKLDGER